MLHTIKRDGNLAPFDASKIEAAIAMAFLKDADGNPRVGTEHSAAVREKVKTITGAVVSALESRPNDGTIQIEDIQDQVELALMRSGEHKIARDYVLYREKRAQSRQVGAPMSATERPIHVLTADSELVLLNLDEVLKDVERECCGTINRHGMSDAKLVLKHAIPMLYDEMPQRDVNKALVFSARSLIERDSDFAYVAAALFLRDIRQEVFCLDHAVGESEAVERYPDYFMSYIQHGIAIGRLDPRLGTFDLHKLAKAMDCSRDYDLQYLGLQILYDRYFIHENERRLELPQIMWMRVAMGLAINEIDREARAIEFYDVLSTFRFVCSTPTLFNAGTTHPQLSSCFLTTVPDDLEGIFDAIKENAMLSKFSGGLGNDWTPVRGMGAWIKGTNGKSQGVVPFLKVVNDTAVAVNQGGKRKGAVCAYLETWHIDMEEFLDLRKNTGDDRRRMHDMDTANWIPDLFMERMEANAEWTLFSPNEVPDLHDLFGRAFKDRYEEYEHLADEGKITLFKRVNAVELWRKMLGALFETGHPWITFKDPCNIRSPQGHVGVVHSSNLCTEITLNSSNDETAVCNLGSVNLLKHIILNPVIYTEGDEQVRYDGKGLFTECLDTDEVLARIDTATLEQTVRTAMRMLDNVIDLNFYASNKARNANMRHRAVGLGLMGFADSLSALKIPMDCAAAVTFADVAQEVISYFAIDTSADLARERGSYHSFPGSDWSMGVLPIDTVSRLVKERAMPVDIVMGCAMDEDHWLALRAKVAGGMRNSNCMAIAPTATISNIVGVSQGIDPVYQNLFVKSNLSGEFTVVNRAMESDLAKLDLWDDVMVNDLKYFDGSLAQIDRVPADLKRLYATAFEIDPKWLVQMAAHRQKWIDQAQSLNLYLSQPSGKKLDALYRLAWRMGLKTTYYLRSLGATSAEKSTVERGSLNAVSAISPAPKACLIDDPTCEACQ
ncbi:ribonucleoside-diphosphate reductase subunit alpha [Acidithiobacillus ferrivorans]|nr:ribonucleoside-diphosphate reductase subunit alpha [Acidithiobacillus ferrivorans]